VSRAGDGVVDEVLRRAAAHVVVDDVDVPSLAERDEHHLVRVLRLRDGELVTVTDGAGAWRACRFVGGRLEPESSVATVPRRASPVVIGVAIPKRDKPEWIVQKLTELGADRIVFLHAERSVVRWDDERARKHLARARLAALEALHQCRAVWLPTIEGPAPAAAFLPLAVAADPAGRVAGVGDRMFAVGPEGGWTDDELACASDRVRLPGAILRVETAAITACVHAVGLDFTV
jgi:16S rRNA (uracil1498-N3)-methyltransferase